MPRSKQEYPTPAELEVLQVLWQQGPSTVRSVMQALESKRKGRAYTSVMSLMHLMFEKGLVRRRSVGRAFEYEARVSRAKTLRQMVGDLCQRAFSNSASSLVAHVLDQTEPSAEEIQAIREAIDAYQRRESSP